MTILTIDSKKMIYLLAKKQMTRRELAARAGIHEGNIGLIFKRGTCLAKTVGRLAAALDVDVSEIIAEE